MYDKTAFENVEKTDLNTKHFFSENVYAKQMSLPAGHVAISHSHKYDHISILASGRCMVYTDNEMREYIAPACINIKAGVEHQIEASEDVTWYCIHATSETDISKIDRVLINDSSV